MTATQIKRTVSQVTGKSVPECVPRGCYLVGTLRADDRSDTADRPPQVVDWNELDAWRYKLTE